MIYEIMKVKVKKNKKTVHLCSEIRDITFFQQSPAYFKTARRAQRKQKTYRHFSCEITKYVNLFSKKLTENICFQDL